MMMYAKGMSTRDIAESLQELYGMEVSAATISAMTDKSLPLVEAWQNRPLEAPGGVFGCYSRACAA
jgi:putative transposase